MVVVVIQKTGANFPLYFTGDPNDTNPYSPETGGSDDPGLSN